MKNPYEKEYSEKSLFEKIKNFACKAGLTVIYAVLLLFYALQKKDLPLWAKSVILGALGYFIFPLDAIPDFTPVVGYLDDFGVLVSAIATTVIFIDNEVKMNAKNKLRDWFSNYKDEELYDIDRKLEKE